MTTEREVDVARGEGAKPARAMAERETKAVARRAVERQIGGPLVEVGVAWRPRRIVDAEECKTLAANLDDAVLVHQEIDLRLAERTPNLFHAAVVLMVSEHREGAEPRREGLDPTKRVGEPR